MLKIVLLKIAGKFYIDFSLVSMAVHAENFRRMSEMGLSPVSAWSQGWCETGRPVPLALCLAQRSHTSNPRLTTKPRALSARAQTSPAPRNIHFVDNRR